MQKMSELVKLPKRVVQQKAISPPPKKAQAISPKKFQTIGQRLKKTPPHMVEEVKVVSKAKVQAPQPSRDQRPPKPVKQAALESISPEQDILIKQQSK